MRLHKNKDVFFAKNIVYKKFIYYFFKKGLFF